MKICRYKYRKSRTILHILVHPVRYKRNFKYRRVYLGGFIKTSHKRGIIEIPSERNEKDLYLSKRVRINIPFFLSRTTEFQIPLQIRQDLEKGLKIYQKK